MQTNFAYAQDQDEKDGLAHFHQRFHIPLTPDGHKVHYFCGNSLGLQPLNVRTYIEQELVQWAKYGVEGHFEGERPWKYYHHFFKEKMARLVGALPLEVTAMNGLTTNLHLLMVSFYRPTQKRFRIIMEAGAFPSDQYVVETQALFHGFKPEEAIIEIQPRTGEHILRTEDILETIETYKDSTALVFFSGVNYYTGQFFDMKKITSKAHEIGAIAGFDLAHTVGNLPLHLHDWGVDFAAWCSYKYLNSGPGGVSGIFVHERHAENSELPRFGGWWGHEESTRFLMQKGFKSMSGADGWQLSNAPIFAMAPHLASLDIFDEAGMDSLRAKSLRLTAYLEFLLQDFNTKENQYFHIITPQKPEERGCQLSLVLHKNGRKVFDYLQKHGVITDWREPNVIRVAPVPLYNSFSDVWHFVDILKKAINTIE